MTAVPGCITCIILGIISVLGSCEAAFRMLTKEEIAYMFREPVDPRNVSEKIQYFLFIYCHFLKPFQIEA